MSRGPGSCMASLCLCWLKTLFLKVLLILTGTRKQCHFNLLESVKTAAHYNQPVFISLVLERHPQIPVWDRQPNRGSNCSEYIFQPSDSLVAYRSKSLCVTVQIAFLPCLCAGLELAKNVSKAACFKCRLNSELDFWLICNRFDFELTSGSIPVSFSAFLCFG